MLRDELFKEYDEALNKLDEEYGRAKDKARIALQEGLKALRDEAHTVS